MFEQFEQWDKEQYFVLNITIYGRMCLFTILTLNVCGVKILWSHHGQ
jgi:hypothetical protein